MYLWQCVSVHLLSTPVQVSYIAAGHDALQGALQRPTVLPEEHSPIENMRSGPACEQQVQQSLQGHIGGCVQLLHMRQHLRSSHTQHDGKVYQTQLRKTIRRK